MGDYDYEVQEGAAQHDLEDAAKLHGDAATLHQQAGTDYTAANAADQMGAGNEGQVLRNTGDALSTARRTSTRGRAISSTAPASSGTPRTSSASATPWPPGANAADIHAQGAQVVLDFVDLNEQDKTRWTGRGRGRDAARRPRSTSARTT